MKTACSPASGHSSNQSRDFWECDWEYDEMEAIEADCAAHFEEVLKHLTLHLGAPDFCGVAGTEGFAEARLGPADETAFWSRPDARIYLEWSHEDKELPFDIDLRLIPPQGRAAA